MIAPHGLLHSHINLWGATLVTFGPLSIVAHNSLQADDVCGGEAGGVGTEECFQCGHHVTGGDTLQVEDGP